MENQRIGNDSPFNGAHREDTGDNAASSTTPIAPIRKLNIFISSISGCPQYDAVRKDLKEKIERTGLAQVYVFEGEQASTMTAENHYLYALKDSDVCIFLIDNKDGIRAGVQAEIDTAQRFRIQSLYYFCDEKSVQKTPLEQSLIGARYAKSKTIHTFSSLSENGAQGLIDDIINIYHQYCKGRLNFVEDTENETLDKFTLSDLHTSLPPIIPKSVLEKISKCRKYLLKETTGYSWEGFADKSQTSSEIDDWCVQFLPILFKGKTIKEFNASMFLEALQPYQEENYHKVVEKRWRSIQAYFMDDISDCIKYAEDALQLARDTEQPLWVINDILIDIRNQQSWLCVTNNQFPLPEAQKELSNSKESVYYPTLDRLHESLYEKYIDGLFKKKITSPYTVSLETNLDLYGELLASGYIVSMYNGSLTHILLLYTEIKRLLFYLSCRYDDWNYKRNLFKFAIFSGSKDEIEGIQNSYPEVLNRLSSDEAADIMEFCRNMPIGYKRMELQLRVLGTIGYYLDDENFKKQQDTAVRLAKKWLNEEQHVVVDIGYSIFPWLSGVAVRVSQDVLAEICCLFMDRQYRRWYMKMFEFIAHHVDLREMSEHWANELVLHLSQELDNEQARNQIRNQPVFLCTLRKQRPDLTEKLDCLVEKYFPHYYTAEYRLEMTKNPQKDFPKVMYDYVDQIKHNNEIQGKNGTFFGFAKRYIATLRALLVSEDFLCDAKLMDAMINAVSDTLLHSKESISAKMDAVSFLNCAAVKYNDAYIRNQTIYEEILHREDEITEAEAYRFASNIDGLALKISLQFLYITMGKDRYTELLELFPYIMSSDATIISVSRRIKEYLELIGEAEMPDNVGVLVLQQALQWLRSDNLDIRWNATSILFMLCKKPENRNVVNNQLIQLIGTDNVYIKNLILRNVYKVDGIQKETAEYIVSKCEDDVNFAVRTVCRRVKVENHE